MTKSRNDGPLRCNLSHAHIEIVGDIRHLALDLLFLCGFWLMANLRKLLRHSALEQLRGAGFLGRRIRQHLASLGIETLTAGIAQFGHNIGGVRWFAAMPFDACPQGLLVFGDRCHLFR